MRRSTWFRRAMIGSASVIALVFAGIGGAEQAEAQVGRVQVGFSYGPTYSSYSRNHGGIYASSGHYHGHGHVHRRSRPIYHPPSVHYDRVYHPEYYHWTPGRGVHTHGHYDYVPHYVPGHFDRRHGGHIDLNPHFHD